MDIESITKFLAQLYELMANTNTLIVLALIGLGIICKFTKAIPDTVIPWVLLPVGVVAGLVLIKPAAVGTLHGIVFTALAVLVYELVLKFIVRKFEKLVGNGDDSSSKEKDTK